MKYISLLLIAAGLQLINGVCIPTDYCLGTEISFTFQYTDTYAVNVTLESSYEFECDGDLYNQVIYNYSADCTGESITIEDIVDGI